MINIKKLFTKKPDKITRLFNETIKKHRKLWNWIADNPDEWGMHIRNHDFPLDARDSAMVIKGAYFKINRIEPVDAYCYGCHFSKFLREYSGDDYGTCHLYCPFDWGVNVHNLHIPCFHDEALYKSFVNEIDPLKKVDIARKIANLPINKSLKEFIDKKRYREEKMNDD